VEENKMGIFGKLAFWRKKEEPLPPLGGAPGLGLPKDDLGLSPPEGLEEPTAAGIAPPGAPPEIPGPAPMPGSEPEPTSPMSTPPGFRAQPPPPMGPPHMEKDFELISAKLDALKASLDSVNQRLANLERIARGEHEKEIY
jgi:hypothetical protein